MLIAAGGAQARMRSPIAIAWCTALGRPRSVHECPPGPVTVTRWRTEAMPPTARLSMPCPSIAISPRTGSRSSSALTPRRSPRPSSPTVKAIRTGEEGGASTSSRATCRSTAMPSALSPMPGPIRRPPSRRTVSGVSAGKTVSRCAHTASAGPSSPIRATTLPTSSKAASRRSACRRASTSSPRSRSAKVGAGIRQSASAASLIRATASASGIRVAATERG